MGKADAERDYYGDLELEPTADPNEIKRQFKKLALKYHPDRNPGKEVEYNSKFQAIQSAHEVLGDPQQRAKYDAQRMRAGLLHTYGGSSSSPTRPSVPTRSPMTDFPPPPRPPPYTAPKPTSSSQSSGAQRYKDFRNRADSGVWRGVSTDDPKTKTSAFKAWESMRTPRRGEGPIPSSRRTVPPKAARQPPVPPPREPNGKASKEPSPMRHGWDQFKEPHTGIPSTTRADTTRAPPQKNGFAPSSPGLGGDEPQAPSSYFTVGRGERPTNPRPQTHMPPPPIPGHTPASKRPDPLAPFKDKVGINEPFGNKARLSTPYQTGGGEKTYFVNPGLERSKTSANSRDSNGRTGWYEGNTDSTHHRAASASMNHQKMSPPDKKDTRMPGVSGVYSSSSSSSSSSDEEAGPYSSARPPVTQIPKSRRPRADAGEAAVKPHGGFNPFAPVGDEPLAPQAGLGTGGYEIPRRHSAVHIDTRTQSEGFSEHRKKHEAEKSQEHSTSVPNASNTHNQAETKPSIQRSYSWHDKNASNKDSRSATSEQKDKNPMYEPEGFKIPDYAKNSFPRTASLRSQSSENISTKFSPDNWHGKFFEPPPPSRSKTPREVSPSHSNTYQQPQQQEPRDSVDAEPKQRDPPTTSTSSSPPPPPPPPLAQGKFQHEQWAPHLNDMKFDIPQSPQGRSPSRTSTWKRPRTRPLKTTVHQASVGDAENDATASSATGESLESSKANSDADAMDIDEPTPPPAKTGPQHTNTGYVRAAPPEVAHNTPRQGPTLPPRSPAVAPRMDGHGQPEKKASHLDLEDLKTAYPFAPSNEGLGNMNEMGTTLPQPSHASGLKQSIGTSPRRVKFPNPPLCPSHPLSLTQHSWDLYCLSLRRYLDEWTKFNDQMAEILKSITQESLKCNWMDPEGEGYDKHMNMLSEHQRARIHLDVASDQNVACMRSLGDAMDAKVRGRGGVGRKQSTAGPILEGLL